MTVVSEMTREASALLEFGAKSRVENGFGWLTDEGTVDPYRGVQLWITGRMTHCFALAVLAGRSKYAPLAAHGVAALQSGALRSTADGGWFSRVEADGTVAAGARTSYDHSFVVLAASSALLAGIDGAQRLLDESLASFEALWWDEAAGLVVDARDPQTLEVDPYRGINTNMHWVEALLAAWGATGDRAHLERASRITRFVTRMLLEHDLRLPEHYSADWQPILDYNLDKPADPFRPFGSTPGHWLEWARLIAQLAVSCQEAGLPVADEWHSLPPQMYRLSLAEGWNANGHPGFVYTTDFNGKPVVEQRMHWVLCEALAAAMTLDALQPDGCYSWDVEYLWRFAQEYVVEAPGQWCHELSPTNTPDGATWGGKPDIYHAFQACLMSHLPVCASFAQGLTRMGEKVLSAD